ncbi:MULTISPECIES: AtpZ/AtpI family protein [unclassified Chelatococcus]|uniref:AtpZ/AtpI family protein n=1 Tax=unclassified Chelatococcus TaxID=2638111 RepID=UPI001BD1143B|nr:MULTISPECIES: AtpZ/AtpI family protein [unclassified Chelatococcus]MBS7695773.1 AtpZ/AtpI family protein [Chelatococcus sp. YT9]MBX3555852.1 AtpZ/AtpI family protein [Chelatococcus sp.]
MAGDKPPPSGTNGPAGSRDQELAKRLHDLGDRLAVAEKARQSPSGEAGAGDKADASSLGSAMRLAGEFVSGVIVGAALGWGVDQFFGTKPWGLMILLLLGFAAGVMNVMRAAGFVRSGSRK